MSGLPLGPVARLHVLETQSLGDRSYVVTDGEVAAVVDPQRDVDRVLGLVEREGLRITHVFETHLHNDYVTGGLDLVGRTGATYVVPAGDEVAYERHPVADGDEVAVGRLVVRAVHTPGHTPNHMSYVVVDGGREVAVCSGGSMLFGSVGRTDLVAEVDAAEATRHQHRSVRRLAEALPDEAAVLPTHGFGSFCSAGSTSGEARSTVGDERRTNTALLVDDEDEFVRQLLAGLAAHPRYYAHMSPINRAGPAPVDLTRPEPVDADEVRRRIGAGEWVVDLRSRTAFARGHVAGTVNLEATDSFATYLGWTIPWGTPVTLVGDTEDEVAAAQRQMARIGIDRPAGAASGGPEAWGDGGGLRTYRTAGFAELAAEIGRDEVVVLDVRRTDEWEESRIPSAVHIPFHDLLERMDEVPRAELWVHCASGYRAALAASLLDGAGHHVVVVDDDWDEAAAHAPLAVERG